MPDLTAPAVVTKNDIIAGLHNLGIHAGDNIIVHSSMKSFGYVSGGPKTVIYALMEVLTPQGTLMMPTFNHGCLPEGKRLGFFDPLTTPTVNGIIPETFRKMPCVHRSLNPTHPFAVWGKNAKRYTEFHHRTLTMGRHSPLGLLFADGGSALLMGVTYESNTSHHLVEVLMNAPCLGKRTEAYPVQLPDGRKVMGRTWSWRNGDCPYTDENRYSQEMKNLGLQRETVVGDSKFICFKLQDCVNIISKMLKYGKFGFPSCEECGLRPIVNKRTIPSDWDEEKQRLLPDSEAWTF